ncbi:APC family permease [Geothrix sp. PMB-07]|uniref:APC family permease n=1 Tax=Geothrix sp. PMB-07 TaxID=3068640 RepID=UPI002740C1CE|nr:amino acid permease [Geothrix sp. PMB-07]WLT33178.1 amino acid permease [Geothrix sp. PMB-07]
MSAPGYRRHVGLFSATMLIAGSMIGSGVFIVAADMVRTGHTGGFLLAAWGLTAILTLFAALSYGELAGMFPQAGGQYTYLRETYGPVAGFLYGWTFFVVIECGTIAAVAVGFGKYLGSFFPAITDTAWIGPHLDVPLMRVTQAISVGPYHLGLTPSRLSGIAVVLFLSAVNLYGVKLGARIQNLFTVAKIGGLAALILLGLLLKPSVAPVQTPFLPLDGSPALPFLTALLVVQTGSMFSADAWNSVTFIAGEVKEPQRTIPYSLLIGTTTVCGLYFLANAVYLKVLGPTGIANAPQDRVGSLALQVLLGSGGGLIMAGSILVSMFGCLNGLVLSGARVYQRMAEDGLFYPSAAKLNTHGVPAFGLWIQAFWTCLLTLTGTYGQLLDFVMLPTILFYILTVGGVFLLRWRRPELDRPVRVWGYPVVPALYLLGATAIVGALFIYRPSYSWPGLLLVALGGPVYLAVKPRVKA